VRAFALVLFVTWSLGVPAVPQLYDSAGVDFTLRIPLGWKASLRRSGGVVVTSVPVRNRDDNPERIQLPRGGVYVWVFGYRGVRATGIPPRQKGIRLGEKQVHSCGFGEGYMVRFTDRGRLIQAFVKLGPAAGTEAALAVLESVRVKAR
jgi:hypothetical protein